MKVKHGILDPQPLMIVKEREKTKRIGLRSGRKRKKSETNKENVDESMSEAPIVDLSAKMNKDFEISAGNVSEVSFNDVFSSFVANRLQSQEKDDFYSSGIHFLVILD